MSDAEVTLTLIAATLVTMLISSLFVRRRRSPLSLRPISGYAVLPLAIDESVESDRPIHFSMGASALAGESAGAALASADAIYHLVMRLSFERRLPLVTTSDPVTLALAIDTLRKAYIARDNLESFRPEAAAWYPAGERSMVFAAAAAARAKDLRVSSQILLGNFGSEIAFLAEANRGVDQRLVTNSTTLEGQAVAMVVSDTTIVGEELFAGSAYLNPKDTAAMTSLIALDVLRWLVIGGIVLSIVINAVK
jgi:hypothetical protein